MKLSFKKSTKDADSNNNTNLKWQISDFNYNAKYCSQKIAEHCSVYPNIKPGYLRSLLPGIFLIFNKNLKSKNHKCHFLFSYCSG